MNLHITDSDVLVPASLRTCFRVSPHAPTLALRDRPASPLALDSWQSTLAWALSHSKAFMAAPVRRYLRRRRGVVITPCLQGGHRPVQAVEAPARLGEGAALGAPSVEPSCDGTRWCASNGCGPRDISPEVTVQLWKPQELPGRRTLARGQHRPDGLNLRVQRHRLGHRRRLPTAGHLAAHRGAYVDEGRRARPAAEASAADDAAQNVAQGRSPCVRAVIFAPYPDAV